MAGTAKYFHEGGYFMDKSQCFGRAMWIRTINSVAYYIFYSARGSDGYWVMSTSKCSTDGKAIYSDGVKLLNN